MIQTVIPMHTTDSDIKESKIKFTYTKKYKKIRLNNSCRRDIIHECIWAMLREFEKKGYIKVEQIISY